MHILSISYVQSVFCLKMSLGFLLHRPVKYDKALVLPPAADSFSGLHLDQMIHISR